MKMKKIKILLITTIIAGIMFTANISFASVQSRPGTALTSTKVNDFAIKIRQMEANGGTLGLSGSIDGTTLLDSSNNGIDVHMAKNTEWGTVALLSASAYGSVPNKNSSDTTTGNASGVYNMANNTWEYVAGIWDGTSNQYMSKLAGADSRYVNKYSSNTPIVGDALECVSWKSAGNADWINSSYPVFVRGYNGLFGFSSSSGTNISANGSRGVVVVGAGL